MATASAPSSTAVRIRTIKAYLVFFKLTYFFNRCLLTLSKPPLQHTTTAPRPSDPSHSTPINPLSNSSISKPAYPGYNKLHKRKSDVNSKRCGSWNRTISSTKQPYRFFIPRSKNHTPSSNITIHLHRVQNPTPVSHTAATYRNNITPPATSIKQPSLAILASEHSKPDRREITLHISVQCMRLNSKQLLTLNAQRSTLNYLIHILPIPEK
jgi:hypothetical protein